MLIAKDDRSRILLAKLKAINGKECSFRPLGTQSRKTYIMMGVPPCVTEELLQQGIPDDEVEYGETKVGTDHLRGLRHIGGDTHGYN